MPSRACIASKENEKRKMGSERFNALPGMYCFTDVTDDVTDNTQFQCPPGHVLLHGDWTRKFTPIVVSMPSRACIASGERPEHYPADNGFNALPGMYCFKDAAEKAVLELEFQCPPGHVLLLKEIIAKIKRK